MNTRTNNNDISFDTSYILLSSIQFMVTTGFRKAGLIVTKTFRTILKVLSMLFFDKILHCLFFIILVNKYSTLKKSIYQFLFSDLDFLLII